MTVCFVHVPNFEHLLSLSCYLPVLWNHYRNFCMSYTNFMQLRICKENSGLWKKVTRNSFGSCPCVPGRFGIWKCWFLRREENRRTRKKSSDARTWTNSKPSRATGQGPHWWEASSLTTASSTTSHSELLWEKAHTQMRPGKRQTG